MGNKHFSGSYISSPAIVGTALCKDIAETNIPVEHAKDNEKITWRKYETVAKWSFEKKVYIVPIDYKSEVYNIGKNAKLTCYD
jgi:SWI/SNF-related matrix-associated actin-dependent regulator 1 of chromatin subfamily A